MTEDAAEHPRNQPIPWMPDVDWLEARFWGWRARGAALNSLESDFNLFTSVWLAHGRITHTTRDELRERVFRGALPEPKPLPVEPPALPPLPPGIRAYDW